MNLEDALEDEVAFDPLDVVVGAVLFHLQLEYFGLSFRLLLANDVPAVQVEDILFESVDIVLLHFTLSKVATGFEDGLFVEAVFFNLSSKASDFLHVILYNIISLLRWFNIAKQPIKLLIVLFVKHLILISLFPHLVLYLQFH